MMSLPEVEIQESQKKKKREYNISQGRIIIKVRITKKIYQKSKEEEKKEEEFREEEHKESQEEVEDVVIETEPLLDINIYLMTRMAQWNCKELRAKHEEIWHLMNKF